MDDLYFMIPWVVITLVATLLAVGAYFYCTKYNGGISRYHFDDTKDFSKKKEYKSIFRTGFALCVLAISSFFFLPLFAIHKIQNIVGATSDKISEIIGLIEKFPPFLKPSLSITRKLPVGYINLILICVPLVLSLATIVFIVLVLLQIRNPKQTKDIQNNRKHLFEYNDEILGKINK